MALQNATSAKPRVSRFLRMARPLCASISAIAVRLTNARRRTMLSISLEGWLWDIPSVPELSLERQPTLGSDIQAWSDQHRKCIENGPLGELPLLADTLRKRTLVSRLALSQ